MQEKNFNGRPFGRMWGTEKLVSRRVGRKERDRERRRATGGVETARRHVRGRETYKEIFSKSFNFHREEREGKGGFKGRALLDRKKRHQEEVNKRGACGGTINVV